MREPLYSSAIKILLVLIFPFFSSTPLYVHGTYPRCTYALVHSSPLFFLGMPLPSRSAGGSARDEARMTAPQLKRFLMEQQHVSNVSDEVCMALIRQHEALPEYLKSGWGELESGAPRV